MRMQNAENCTREVKLPFPATRDLSVFLPINESLVIKYCLPSKQGSTKPVFSDLFVSRLLLIRDIIA